MAKQTRKKLKKVLLWLLILAIAAPFAINGWVVASTKSRILTTEEAAKLQDVDCIVVLGCAVRADGTPSPMLAERLARSVELYEAGAAPKLLMSGDNGQVEYNEVAAMANYALQKDVPSYDIFLDYAGFPPTKVCTGPRPSSRLKKSSSSPKNTTCTGPYTLPRHWAWMPTVSAPIPRSFPVR